MSVERYFWAIGGGIETPQGPVTIDETHDFLDFYTDMMRAALNAGKMDELGQLAEVARQLLVARMAVFRWLRAALDSSSCAG